MSAAETAAGQPAGPKRADARRNYELLIAAAAAAFAEHGADDVSLEEVARRAGVGIGTLYRHFPARQNLLEAVYKDQVDGLEVLEAKLRVSESPGAALAEWLRAFTAFGRTKRSLSAALVATIGKDSALMSECSRVLRTWGTSEAGLGELLEPRYQALSARLAAGDYSKPVFVKVSKEGLSDGAFSDSACTQKIDDPYLQSVVRDIRFKPALADGKPVEGVAPVSLDRLKS